MSLKDDLEQYRSANEINSKELVSVFKKYDSEQASIKSNDRVTEFEFLNENIKKLLVYSFKYFFNNPGNSNWLMPSSVMPDPRIFDLHNSWSVNGLILWTGWQFSKLWNMIENAREFDRNIGRKTPLLILTATSNWKLLYFLVKSFSRRRKLPFGCPSKIFLASSRVIWPQKYEQSLYKKFKNSPLFLKFPCIFWTFWNFEDVRKMFKWIFSWSCNLTKFFWNFLII